MLKGLLAELLQTKLGMAVVAQTKRGIGPVPKDDADDLLLRIAQLPHDRVRGLIVIAAIDIEHHTHGAGLDVQTFALGTPATLSPLLELGCHQLDEKLQNPDKLVPGEVCNDCGQVHDEGPFDNMMNFGGAPLERGNFIHDLIATLAAGPMRRDR